MATELSTKQLKGDIIMIITDILLISALLFVIWVYFIKSKFKVGNTVNYLHKSKICSGKIEYVGENFVIINNARIPKKDVRDKI